MAFIIFILGLAVGSFLNSVIYRLEKNESFLLKKSYCPNCKHKLSWLDLIPILSFLILKERCRYCQQRISWQYPLIELATGLLFVFIFWHLDFGVNLAFGFWILEFLYYSVITSFLIVIFIYDLKYYIIPNKIVYPAVAIASLYQLFRIWNFGYWDLSGVLGLGLGILPSVFLLAIILISRGQWMGLGDFKLAVLMGLFLSWPKILLAIFLAFTLGAIIGIGLIISGKKSLKSQLPFAPFLITGTFLALFWGNEITNWYLNILR